MRDRPLAEAGELVDDLGLGPAAAVGHPARRREVVERHDRRDAVLVAGRRARAGSSRARRARTRRPRARCATTRSRSGTTPNPRSRDAARCRRRSGGSCRSSRRTARRTACRACARTPTSRCSSCRPRSGARPPATPQRNPSGRVTVMAPEHPYDSAGRTLGTCDRSRRHPRDASATRSPCCAARRRATCSGATRARRAARRATSPRALRRRRRPRRGDRRDQAPVAVEGRPRARPRSRPDRQGLRGRRRGRALGAHRRARSSAGAVDDLQAARDGDRAAGAAQGLHDRRGAGLRVAGDRRRRDPPDRRPRSPTTRCSPTCTRSRVELGLAVLVEAHDAPEIERALRAGARDRRRQQP